MSDARRIARQVLELEAAAIEGLLDQLDSSFDEAVALLEGCQGRIVCSGMGKSGHVMRKLAATFSSTGTPALFLHPAEAIHGDLGMIVRGDVVLAASFSGSTEELLRMLPSLQRKKVPLIAITGNPKSPLAEKANVHLVAEIDKEACPLNLAPTASTTATLALGDALAMTLLERRGFSTEDFAHLHPGGALGQRLLEASEIMHAGDAVPVVSEKARLQEAIVEMSSKGLGVTAVVDERQRLVGVFSDGDLRRLLESDETPLARAVGEVMTRGPKTVSPNERLEAVLELLETHRITSLFVCNDEGLLEGVVHIHDLWRIRRSGK